MTIIEIPNESDNVSRLPRAIDPMEAALLGAMLLSAKAIDQALNTGLERDAFTTTGHPEIWAAIIDLYKRGDQADPVTVSNELRRNGDLETAGGGPYLVDLQNGTPAISHAPTYAARVVETWTTRRASAALVDAHEAIRNGAEPRATIANIADRLPADTAQGNHARIVDGATFLLDQPDTITSVWGTGDTSLWADGEALMIVGPTGIGKTTLCQQVILGRIGLRHDVLGEPVTEGNKRVLYLACDRPQQAARSMRRMVQEEDREILEDLLAFWKGPLPFDVVNDPGALARFAKQHAADTIVIDSLKDICFKLNDDEHASKTNAAIQELLACGIEVAVNHHQRKAIAGTKKAAAPKTIDEVYGNTWLTAGMGSVLLVWGEAGDAIIELSHLKSPAEQVGPWTLRMDFDRGHTTIEEEVSVLGIINAATRGATVNLVARALFKTEEPTRNEDAKARRRLDRLVDQGHIARREIPSENGGKPTAMYYPIDRRHGQQ